MQEQLATLEPFRDLDAPALDELARRARLVRVSKKRWLARAGGATNSRLFLLSGTVEHHRDGRMLRTITAKGLGSRQGSKNPPRELVREDGDDAFLARTDVEVILVDEPRAPARAPGMPTRTEVPAWMQQLLAGPVMQWFSPLAWAKLLRAGRIGDVAKGTRIIGRDDVAQLVFVVVEGAVSTDTTRYKPGDFFGETSLLTARPFGEDAVMAEDGALMRIPGAAIRELAGSYLVPDAAGETVELDLGSLSPQQEDAAIAALTPGATVAPRGGDADRLAAITAKLLRRGLRVV